MGRLSQQKWLAKTHLPPRASFAMIGAHRRPPPSPTKRKPCRASGSTTLDRRMAEARNARRSVIGLRRNNRQAKVRGCAKTLPRVPFRTFPRSRRDS